jgi:hypothetical protein
MLALSQFRPFTPRVPGCATVSSEFLSRRLAEKRRQLPLDGQQAPAAPVLFVGRSLSCGSSPAGDFQGSCSDRAKTAKVETESESACPGKPHFAARWVAPTPGSPTMPQRVGRAPLERGRRRRYEQRLMRLATLADGSRDGALIVVKQMAMPPMRPAWRPTCGARLGLPSRGCAGSRPTSRAVMRPRTRSSARLSAAARLRVGRRLGTSITSCQWRRAVRAAGYASQRSARLSKGPV